MKVAMPVADLLTKQSKKQCLDFLSQSQFWPRGKIEEFQNIRLQSLVKHSYRNVPYYRDLFDKYGISPSQIQCVSDLSLLPVLGKKDIRAGINTGQLMDITANMKRLESNNSSGSTGEPLQFFLNSEAASMKKAAAIRAWQWMGFRMGDKIVRLSPLERSHLIKKIQDRVTRTLYIQAYQMNDAEFERIYTALQRFSPSILRSYPDPLFLFVRYMSKHNLKPPKLKAINSTGSTLFDSYRRCIEDFFSCRVYDSFSCEGSAGASQCSNSLLYHLSDEYSITEVIDKDGFHANKGRLITTDLWNYATPFIRYDTQDLVEKSKKNCSCNRGLGVIKRIHGRSADILVTRNKQYLFANNFTGHFQNLSGIDQYQIYQQSLDRVVIRIKANDKYNNITTRMIKKLFKQIAGEEFNVSFEFVDEIPLSPSGKRRFLIRDDSVPLDI